MASARCEAVGYLPADGRISENGRLRFRKFLFCEQSYSATVRLTCNANDHTRNA
jgi:hypothetical protein